MSTYHNKNPHIESSQDTNKPVIYLCIIVGSWQTEVLVVLRMALGKWLSLKNIFPEAEVGEKLLEQKIEMVSENFQETQSLFDLPPEMDFLEDNYKAKKKALYLQLKFLQQKVCENKKMRE